MANALTAMKKLQESGNKKKKDLNIWFIYGTYGSKKGQFRFGNNSAFVKE